MLQKLINKIYRLLLGFKIEFFRISKKRINDRFSYQSKYFNFDSIKEKSLILDIDAGNHPFLYATILSDKFEVKDMMISSHGSQHRSKPETVIRKLLKICIFTHDWGTYDAI